MEKRKDHPELVLTGSVYVRGEDFDPNDLSTTFEDEPIVSGDVSIYSLLDKAGRSAARGGHTNFGYSGYFGASIFDGKKFRRFRTLNFIAKQDGSFAAQKNKPEVQVRVKELIRQQAGRKARWTEKSYELEATD